MGEIAEEEVGKPVAFQTLAGADDLPLFEKAAKETGFKLEVIGKAGEPYEHVVQEIEVVEGKKYIKQPLEEVKKTDIIPAGYMSISITEPEGNKEKLTPFFNAFYALKESAQATPTQVTKVNLNGGVNSG